MTGASLVLLFFLCLRSERLQLYNLHLVSLPLVEVPLCTGTDLFIASLVSHIGAVGYSPVHANPSFAETQKVQAGAVILPVHESCLAFTICLDNGTCAPVM